MSTPDLADDVNAAVDEKFKTIVSSNGGSVLSYLPWGKKKLAYPVKKRSRGLYVLMEYCGGPELVAELERNMRLDERILKFITVKLDDRYDPEKEEALKAAEAAKAVPAFEEDEEGVHRSLADLDAKRKGDDDDSGDEGEDEE